MCASIVIQEAVKLRHSFFKWNFNICNVSISKALIRVHFLVLVSTLDEKIHLQGTEEAWISK
jgi:hypothetical protein